jgi:hypothetical protein
MTSAAPTHDQTPDSAPKNLPAGDRPTLRRVFHDVATSAPVIFSAGNLVWSCVTAQPWAIALNAAVLATTIGTQVHDTLTQKKTGVPFYVTSAVNGLTAVATVARGVSTLGLAPLFNVIANPAARHFVFSAVAFAGWSAAHFVMGYRDKHGHDPRFIGKQPIHAGYADIFMTAADTAKAVNVGALGLIGAGLTKAIFGKPQTGEIDTAAKFANKHITPNRLYAACFTGSALLALSHPVYAVVQGLWGYGYSLLDPRENNELIADAKKLLARNDAPKNAPQLP